MELKTKREAVIETINKLFVYTDSRQWQKLMEEVFTEEVLFDMSSLGAGPATRMKSRAICDMWAKGFDGIDHVHHQSGNFIVDFNAEGEADVLCYAIAIHYKKAARQGNTREFVGSYTLHTSFTDDGWRIDSFRYDLKYIAGNTDLV
jgi:hypothetical protein